MPLIRNTPAPRTGTAARQRAFLPASIRGRISALLDEEGVVQAIQDAPVTVADIAASLPVPTGKELEQWKKEIGSVIAVDLKEQSGLFHLGFRRFAQDVDGVLTVVPGRFTLVPVPPAAGFLEARPAAAVVEADEALFAAAPTEESAPAGWQRV